jgi:hypothetical protein
MDKVLKFNSFKCNTPEPFRIPISVLMDLLLKRLFQIVVMNGPVKTMKRYLWPVSTKIYGIC